MIDFSKPVQTRAGKAVRLLCIDGPASQYPVIGIVAGETAATYWSANGEHCVGESGPWDLMQVPVKQTRTFWVNVYPESWMPSQSGVAAPHRDQEQADRAAGKLRIACIPVTIEFTEGQGL